MAADSAPTRAPVERPCPHARISMIALHRFRMTPLRILAAALLLGIACQTTGRSEPATPLYAAITKGDLAAVQALLAEKKADPNEAGEYGMTPLRLAAQFGHTDIARALLDAGARVDAKTSAGRTPLCVAAMHGRLDTVRLLLDRGARLDTRDAGGQTPLMYAQLFGRDDTTRELLRRKAEVNDVDDQGASALMFAALFGHASNVRLLLERGADPELKNKEGQTALDLARTREDNDDVIALLKKAVEKKNETRSAP